MGGPAVLTFDPTRVQLKKAAPAESPRPEKTSSPGGFDISKVKPLFSLFFFLGDEGLLTFFVFVLFFRNLGSIKEDRETSTKRS